MVVDMCGQHCFVGDPKGDGRCGGVLGTGRWMNGQVGGWVERALVGGVCLKQVPHVPLLRKEERRHDVPFEPGREER